MVAVTNITVGGWACFVIGAILLLAGAALGVYLGAKEPDAKTKEDIKKKADQAKTQIEQLTQQAVKAANTDAKDTAAATESKEKGDAAASTVKDLEGLLKALPERLRFAGFLIIFGALLMSVATVQFGGHSIF